MAFRFPFYKRQIEDFDLVTLLKKNSFWKFNLRTMKKKARSSDDTSKSKYSNLHFIKTITHDPITRQLLTVKQKIQYSIDDVRGQEFLRLLIPTQPKARLIFDDSDGVYIQSKEIRGLSLLLDEQKEEVDKQKEENIRRMLNTLNYGTPNGLKGLGELFFLSAIILQDGHFVDCNIGYVGQQLYKINGGLAFQKHPNQSLRPKGIRFCRIIEPVIEELFEQKHPVFIREMNRARLKFIVLPALLIEKFQRHYDAVDEIGRYSGEDYFKKSQDICRKIDKRQECNISEFVSYVLSEDALQDIAEYQEYLKTFKLTGKKVLLDQCPNALEEIDDLLLNYRQALPSYTTFEHNSVDPASSGLQKEANKKQNFQQEPNSSCCLWLKIVTGICLTGGGIAILILFPHLIMGYAIGGIVSVVGVGLFSTACYQIQKNKESQASCAYSL